MWVYRYAIVAGVASGGLAFLSNYLNGRTIATITGALALSHDKIKTYFTLEYHFREGGADR